MAVDFKCFPPEEHVSDRSPSRSIWAVVFFLIVIAGVLSVLLLWPKGETTRSLWFWVCVTMYPLGVAAFVLLRRYSVYEGRRLDQLAWNDARNRYMDGVFAAASRPFAVLAAVRRFSSNAEDDDLLKLMDGSVRLEPNIPPKPDSPPVFARWFDTPDVDRNEVAFDHDDARQCSVLAWAFSAVIDSVGDSVRSLPSELSLKVALCLPGVSGVIDAQDLWGRQWLKSGLRYVEPEVSAESLDPMFVDIWLDQVNQRPADEARLVVLIRLNPILQLLPPERSAEVIVAMLLAPEAVCQRFKLMPLAMLHRPNEAADCSGDDAVARALQWGRVDASDIKRVWQGGLEGSVQDSAAATLAKACIDAEVVNVDQMVGHAGTVGAWFGMACAAGAAALGETPQLVATTTHMGSLCFTVVRNDTFPT